MRDKIIKYCLLILVLTVLVLPMLQMQFHFLKLTPLNGALEEPLKKELNSESWFSGAYQEEAEKYLNETFGFRSLLIRINNQITYSLFNKAKANGVIIGKNNYLFEENYIKAYYGQDFIGKERINERMQNLKSIQDTLAKLNKQIILVFAAGKGSFYPEYFPDDLRSEKGQTNYQEHLKLAKALNLNFIDFNQFFMQQKNKSKYPLYPQHGIHWSQYGTCLVADSMVKYLEEKRNIDLPNISWNEVELDQARATDYDIADGMNLKFKLKSFPMAYPKLLFESKEGKDSVSVLVISDSFYKSMFDEKMLTNSFANNQFWYYNKQIFLNGKETQTEVNQLNIQEEIKKYDVIILMATEATLPDLGWGFIEKTHQTFSKKKK